MNHKRAFILLPALLWFVFASPDLVAQQATSSVPCRPRAPEDTSDTPPELRAIPYCSPKEPVGCEVANFYTDIAASKVRALQDTYLIVIGRLGDGEKSRRLNLRRMGIVRDFLTNNRGVKKIVTAEGERIKGYGQVELYVGGKLLFALPARRNKIIDLGGCNAP